MIILTSKIMPPRRTRGLITRERLERLFKQVQEHRITLVMAPPGYGKSTLGRSWTDHLIASGKNVAWLGLDQADDEATRFSFYVVATIRRTCPDIGNNYDELASGVSAFQPESVLSPLLNELAELETPIFLFIDDVQHLKSAKALRCLELLLRSAPPSLHIVLLGRSLPSINMIDAAAYGEVFGVGIAELRFTLEETFLLAEKHKPDTRQQHPEAAKLIQDISNGWAAALRILLLSLSHQENAANELQRVASSNRPLALLIGDLLDQLPIHLSLMLEQIALPERVCASLVHNLVGAPDAQEQLEHIVAMQLFLSPLDDEGQWYAFHPLFREYLENRLRRKAPERFRQVHLAAGSWFAANGMHRSAVRHALMAGDIELALNWIETCAMSLIESGSMLTLIGWERELNQHSVPIPLRLKLALAWAHSLAMTGDEGHRLLAEVESELRRSARSDPHKMLYWECQALRVTLFSMDDQVEAAGELARKCLANIRIENTWLKAVLSTGLSYSLSRECRWIEMYAVVPHSVFRAGDSQYELTWAYRLWIQAGAERTQGNLQEARTYLAEALRLLSSPKEMLNSRSITTAHAVIRSLSRSMTSDMLYLQNRIDEAGIHAAEAIEVVRVAGSLDAVRLAFCVAARVAAHQGNRHRARILLDDAEAIAIRRRWRRLTAVVLMERARIALVEDRVDEARGHAERLAKLTEDPALTLTVRRDADMLLCTLRGWIALRAGKSQEAGRQVAAAIYEARKLHLRLTSASMEVVRALALDMAGEHQEALASLFKACQDVAAGNALRPILDTPVCAEQLRALIQAGRAVAPDNLIDFLEKLAPDTQTSARPSESATVTAKLSTREYQIMRLVSEGGSNKEIGRILNVAPETVKYHLKNIFTKLGVNSRAEAAAMAARIGIAAEQTSS